MNKEFEVYSKWVFTRLIRWISITFVITSLLSALIKNKVETYELYPYVIFQSFFVIALTVIDSKDFKSDLWSYIAVVSMGVFSVEFALHFSILESICLFFCVVIVVFFFKNYIFKYIY